MSISLCLTFPLIRGSLRDEKYFSIAAAALPSMSDSFLITFGSVLSLIQKKFY